MSKQPRYSDYVEAAEWRTHSWAPVIRDAMNALGPETVAGKSVLEIGFGTGHYAALWAKLGANVEAIEKYVDEDRRAERYLGQQGVRHLVELSVGDFFDLTGRYDIIATKGVLFSIEDLDTYAAWLNQFAKLLAPGGRILVIENGSGNGVIRGYRKYLHKHRSYYDNVLSDPRVLDLYRQRFESVEYTPYYSVAPLVPWELPARAEYRYIRPHFGSRFIYWLLAENPLRAGESA